MTDRIQVATSSGQYDIVFGVLQELDFSTKYSKVLLVTNNNIANFYLDWIKVKILHPNMKVFCLEDGEDTKNFDTVQKIIDFALQEKLDRKSLMIAFGGGVVSDIVGFVSGIYQRGIDFINIPTTLLAQVDASVGGKTGINTIYGKNLVGLFHQPSAVYIDTYFLKTLPKREFNSGIAEIIKVAVCFDEDFFCFLENNDLYCEEILQKAIQRSVELKAKIIMEDEREKGIRAGLNYGHTFGHVIELETEYKQFLHGEAVTMGMIMANALALKEKMINKEEAERILKLLKKYDLGEDYKIKDKVLFYQRFFLDKKTQNDKLHFILPQGIGKMCICDNIAKENIMEILGEFC